MHKKAQNAQKNLFANIYIYIYMYNICMYVFIYMYVYIYIYIYIYISVYLALKKCFYMKPILRKKCPYLKLFWSSFSRIWTEYGDIRSFSPYSVQMGEIRTSITPNTDTSCTVHRMKKSGFFNI